MRKNLLLFLFSIVLSFLLIELVLRILHMGLATNTMIHPLYGWAHIPSAEGWRIGKEFHVRNKVNTKGLMDVEHDYLKPNNTFRILVLGDSMMAGYHVPGKDIFARKLEDKLNSMDHHFRKTIEVINEKYGN